MGELSVHIDSMALHEWPAGEAVAAAIRDQAGGALPPELLAEISRAVTRSLGERVTHPGAPEGWDRRA